MMVSHQTRTLFVHVQKTGGLTIESVFNHHVPDAEHVKGLPGAKHARLRAALREHPDYADYWIFGFVRNPWSRMWSWYSMIERRRDAAAAGDEVTARRIGNNTFWSSVLTEIPDFEAFVLRGPDLFPRMRVPQVTYLRSKHRDADFIGRTETFAADLATVCDRLGVDAPAEAPRRNAGHGGDWRAAYTPAMRQRVADLYELDLRVFGYEF